MVLDLKKIEEEVRQPSKKRTIERAIEQQDRIKFHADTSLDIVDSLPYRKFKSFVQSILPQDKYELTMSLLKFPIPTNEICESVWVHLSKIFDGRNPAINYQFHNTQERDDWEWYRQEMLGEPSVWANKAYEFFKTEINCVLVVDMPSEMDASDSYPQPYFYFVPIESVISYAVNPKSGIMDWIIYQDNGRLIAIDDEAYWTFDWDGVNLTFISRNPHTLGYTPSRFFWSEPLSLSQPDIKKSPLSKELANLDWYLFYCLGKRHLDTYAGYPIYSAYEEECDYTDKEGNVCHHGHLQKPEGDYLTDINGNPIPCPLCSRRKNLAGAGTFVSVPIPEDGQPDLRKPIDITTIDTQSLKYNVEEKERLRRAIIASCVGVENTILNEVSLADKQVDASFESQEIVLNRIKKGFESAQEFVDSTICRLRYGEAFISADINYGTEFYTLTPEVLQSRYNKAKDGGASEYELSALREQIIDTEYRHNPVQKQRMIILADLEPFQNLTKEEVMGLYREGVITRDELMLKHNFNSYVRKFERVHDNILYFGAEMPYEKRIDTIYKTLLSYAAEQSAPNLGTQR